MDMQKIWPKVRSLEDAASGTVTAVNNMESLW